MVILSNTNQPMPEKETQNHFYWSKHLATENIYHHSSKHNECKHERTKEFIEMYKKMSIPAITITQFLKSLKNGNREESSSRYTRTHTHNVLEIYDYLTIFMEMLTV